MLYFARAPPCSDTFARIVFGGRAKAAQEDVVTFVEDEIASQPQCWERAAGLAAETAGLPIAGERLAVVGCGTSWFMAQAYAGLREGAGQGETDAFTASEVPARRHYDRVLAITRSGTTTEVLALLDRLRTVPTTAITADPNTPVMQLADSTVVLDFADERSVVQTRFATTTLTLLRASLGLDLTTVIAQGREALAEPLPDGLHDRRQFTFLSTGWSIGLANESALKMREASLSWTEAYPAMEYRHGPMSITDEHSAVWLLGHTPSALPAEVAKMGGLVVESPGRDAQAELVRVQRFAVSLGLAKGQNPDQPRNLTRSVILEQP
jgi:fructoselysine-6-P-deglycase FrlB-like protein